MRGNAAILVVEDDFALREALCDTLNIAGYHAEGTGDGLAALERLDSSAYDLVVSDVQMRAMDGYTLLKNIKSRHPDTPVLLMTAYGTIQKAVQAMREGAADYLVKPVEAEVLLTLVQQLVSDQLSVDSDFVAADPRSQDVQQIAKRVAESDATVLITGESGVGKEVLARYIHKESRRSAKPFVAINCAAIPENMLEATLFGYEKGAFTGAVKACPGKFEQAQDGTLLLDEISEMDLALQAKLLRVLQEREVERLGGISTIQLDVRVLATSNRTIRDEVAAGRFREDLYYRLNVFPIELPPLRDRRADIAPIAHRLIERCAKHYQRPAPQLADDAAAKLASHNWPGNVRELDNVIQRALILQRGPRLHAGDIRFENSPAQTASRALPVVAPPAPEPIPEPAAGSPPNLQNDVKQHEASLIIATLRDCFGNRKTAAQKLGISERTLRYKMARLREAGILDLTA